MEDNKKSTVTFLLNPLEYDYPTIVKVSVGS